MTEEASCDSARLDELTKEAREIAEEELAFVRDYPTEDRIVVSRRSTYKRQLALCEALAASLARERETAAVLPKAWAVLGLVDKLKQGDTFVAKELREALIALANQDGAAGRSGGGTGET